MLSEKNCLRAVQAIYRENQWKDFDEINSVKNSKIH